MRTAGAAIAAGVLLTLLAGIAAAVESASRATSAPVTAPAALGPACEDQRERHIKRVNEAIDRGVKYLLSRRKADGSWPAEKLPGGIESALAPTAAALAGMAAVKGMYHDEEMEPTQKWLAGQECGDTLSLYLRLLAARESYWFRTESEKTARRDLKLLLLCTQDGSYGSQCSEKKITVEGDLLNSWFGAMGIFCGQHMGEEIPYRAYRLLAKYWLGLQRANGSWAPTSGEKLTAFEATAAGVAVTGLCLRAECPEPTVPRIVPQAGSEVAAERGLRWLDTQFAAALQGAAADDLVFLLHVTQEAGWATGRNVLGRKHWHSEGTAALLKAQNKDGSWPGRYGPMISTSLAIRFLLGRPVLLAHLRHGGDWNNRPRAATNLARALSQEMSLPEAEAIVADVDLWPPDAWRDAPVLLVTGTKPLAFTAAQIESLRRYAQTGGMIVTVGEGPQTTPFRDSVRQLHRQLFPTYPLERLDANHLVFTAHQKIADKRTVNAVSNGVRLLAIDVGEDLTRNWETCQTKTDRRAFQMMANIFLHATDRTLPSYHGPHVGVYWPKVPAEFVPKRTVRVARLEYTRPDGNAGNFDPEPLAWERFAATMAMETETKVDVRGPMEIAKLADANAALAVLSGTNAMKLIEAEVNALKRFMDGGGVLLIEAAGGSKEFADAAREQVKRLTDLPVTVGEASPITARKDYPMGEVRYRQLSRQQFGLRDRQPRLAAAQRPAGGIGLVFSAEDLTVGMLGLECCGVHGYAPRSAFELMRNIVLMATEVPETKVTGARPAGP